MFEAEWNRPQIHQNSLNSLGFYCISDKGNQWMFEQPCHFSLTCVEIFAISGCSMEAPVTYNISKSIENKYIESAYRMYDVGGVSLTCSSCINSFNKSSNSFLNGQILYWMIKSFIKWLIGSLNHQASPSQPTVESGYKNRARRPPRAPQATQDRPRPSPDHPQHPQATPGLKLQKYVKVLIWKILAMTARLGTPNLQNVLVFIVNLTMYLTKLALKLCIYHYFIVIILIVLSFW